MRIILGALDTALKAGEIVYVHCWGGVGRTGTVVGCHLVELDVPNEIVLDAIVMMRKNTKRSHRISPEPMRSAHSSPNGARPHQRPWSAINPASTRWTSRAW